MVWVLRTRMEVSEEARGNSMDWVMGSHGNYIHLHYLFQHLQLHPFLGVFLSSFKCFPVSNLGKKFFFEPVITP